jgi:hypothetical protein
VSAVQKALNYTEVSAEVERVELRCAQRGETPHQARTCDQVRGSDGPLERFVAVQVRYTSPADGRQYVSTMFARTEKKMRQAALLRPGQGIKIYAHDERAGEILAD